MAGGGGRPHHERMTAPHRPRTARLARRRVGIAGILPLAALLLIAGCASPDTAPVADDAPSDNTENLATETDSSDGDGGEGAVADEPADDSEAVIEGADLVTDSFVLIGAETYAEGRDPIPTVTFTGPLSVTFTFATTLDEAAKIGNCQIAYGVLDASGVDITIVDDAGETDCTALVEG